MIPIQIFSCGRLESFARTKLPKVTVWLLSVVFFVRTFKILSVKIPIMTKRKSLPLGKGAICSASYCHVHPRPLVQQKHPNIRKKDVMGGLICQRKEVRMINKVERVCEIFRHEDFAPELYVVLRFVKVEQVGESFDATTQCDPPSNVRDTGRELPAELRRANSGDIHRMRAEGFDVDDDNDPAPENIPESTSATNLSLGDNQQGKKDGLCRRDMTNARELHPSVGMNVDLQVMTLLVCSSCSSHLFG
jgi:hypothetical protein